MQDFAGSSLRSIGILAIVFLAIEVGGVAPIVLFVLKSRLARIHELRMTLFALLIAVPRPIALEFSQREVSLGVLEEDDADASEQYEAADLPTPGVQAPQTGNKKQALLDAVTKGDPKSRRRRVQQLLAMRLPYTRVLRARQDVISGSAGERGAWRRRAGDLLFLLPVLAWAAVIAVVEGMTWQLQRRERHLLEPKYAVTTFTYAATAIITWSGELVALAAEGASADVLATTRTKMTDAANLSVQAIKAFIFGNRNFQGRNVVGGTIWDVPALTTLFFGDVCLASSGSCADEADLKWLDQRGLYITTQNLVEEAKYLATDHDAWLTPLNERYQLLQNVGTSDLFKGVGER